MHNSNRFQKDTAGITTLSAPPFFKTIDVLVKKDGYCDWAALNQCHKSISKIIDAFSEYLQLKPIQALANQVIGLYPLFWKEIKQVALISNTSPEQLLAVNLLYDFTSGLYGCTAFAINDDTGPLHCHCLDWELGKEVLEDNTILIRFLSEEKELLFISVGWPGFLGVYYGVAPGKFAVTLNAAWSKEKRKSAIPLGLFLRNVFLNETGYTHALKSLEETPLNCDCILLITGTSPDEMAIVERTPLFSAIRRNSPILATNHFVDLPHGLNEPDYVQTGEEPFGVGSFERYENAKTLFLKNPPVKKQDCRYYLNKPPIINDLTIHRTIFETNTGKIEISSIKNLEKWHSNYPCT